MDTVSVPGDLSALIVRLVLATLLGAAVGVNREISLKPAGLRTHALVSLGAALATIVGLLLSGPQGDVASPGRIIQGIVAGVGFIGGGVILHLREARTVQGLTTAASIWVVSATGIAAGAGLWRSALAAIGLTLLVLTIGRRIDHALHRGGPSGPDDD
jgi:putative Mg2+ transporter-C (MgtC) family protein